MSQAKRVQLPEMIALNLVPPTQIMRLREASIVRGWILAGCVGVAMLAVWFSALQAGRVSDEQLHQQMTTAQSRLALVRADAVGAANERLSLESRTEAARAVGFHPRWSVLMHLLNQHREPGVTLTRVSVKESADVAPSAPRSTRPPVNHKYEVQLRGLAPSMRAANDYAVALEELGLFTSVRTTETGQDTRFSEAGSLVSFTLLCEIAGNKKKEDAKPALPARATEQAKETP